MACHSWSKAPALSGALQPTHPGAVANPQRSSVSFNTSPGRLVRRLSPDCMNINDIFHRIDLIENAKLSNSKLPHIRNPPSHNRPSICSYELGHLVPDEAYSQSPHRYAAAQMPETDVGPALIRARTPRYMTYAYPTLPSKLTPSNFCASTANSIGSSLNTSLQNPLTIMLIASSNAIPRVLQ